MKILMTGETGFLGRYLSMSLIVGMFDVVSIIRDKDKIKKTNNIIHCVEKSFDKSDSWLKNLEDVQVVIHSAARVHAMKNDTFNPLEEFREINTRGTLNLAQQAADSSVKRFIFISSIKVNGELSKPDQPFRSIDLFVPEDPYGLSKYEAELGLKKIAEETGMEVVIIRPPLVYGPGVKANFLSMMNLMSKGLPLPLGGIKKNKRSLVFIENLIDLIVTCIDHPKAANKTFLVSDDFDVSTTQLLSSIAKNLNVPNRLLPIPSSWLEFIAKILGKSDVAQRLCGSLQVDIDETKSTLGWQPPYSFDEGIKKTTEAFLNKKTK